MADLTDRFEAAAEAVQGLSSRPGNDDLLALYALYKQATVGDVRGKRPGFMDFAGGAKYDAWEKIQGMTADEAMTKYIEKVESLTG